MGNDVRTQSPQCRSFGRETVRNEQQSTGKQMNNVELMELAVILGSVFGDTGNFIILLLTLEVYLIRAALLEQIEVIHNTFCLVFPYSLPLL